MHFNCPMQIGLRQFENVVVEWFKTTVGGDNYRRYGLAKESCKRVRKARTASVALRIAKVQLKAPGKRTDSLPDIAVSVFEEREAARVKKPLN